MTSCLTSAAEQQGCGGENEKRKKLSLHFTVKLYFLCIMVVACRLDTNNNK